MRQYCRTTIETTYGVFPTSPAAGTQNDFFLPVSNAMTVRAMPQFWSVKDAGVGNRTIQKNVGRTNVSGTLQSYLFPSQAAYVLKLGTLLTGSGCLNLPSFSIDSAVVRETDCTTEYRRYLGCKISRLSLSADMSENGWLWFMKADIIGSRPASPNISSTDFPIPALSAYPAEDPYQFGQVAGHVSIGSSRTNIQSLSIDFNNVLKPFPDENLYAQNLGWFGREVTLAAKLLYKGQADRLAYEGGNKQAVSVEIDNGTNTLTMNFGGRCNIDSDSDDFPLDDWETETLTLSALMDPTLGTPTDFGYVTT